MAKTSLPNNASEAGLDRKPNPCRGFALPFLKCFRCQHQLVGLNLFRSSHARVDSSVAFIALKLFTSPRKVCEPSALPITVTFVALAPLASVTRVKESWSPWEMRQHVSKAKQRFAAHPWHKSLASCLQPWHAMFMNLDHRDLRRMCAIALKLTRMFLGSGL